MVYLRFGYVCLKVVALVVTLVTSPAIMILLTLGTCTRVR